MARKKSMSTIKKRKRVVKHKRRPSVATTRRLPRRRRRKRQPPAIPPPGPPAPPPPPQRRPRAFGPGVAPSRPQLQGPRHVHWAPLPPPYRPNISTSPPPRYRFTVVNPGGFPIPQPTTDTTPGGLLNSRAASSIDVKQEMDMPVDGGFSMPHPTTDIMPAGLLNNRASSSFTVEQETELPRHFYSHWDVPS